MGSAFHPTDLIIPPAADAWVERLPNGDYLIRRRQPTERAALTVTDSPEWTAGDRRQTSYALAAGSDSVVVPGLSFGVAARPYFHLDLDGRRLVIAERVLPLAGGVNFRDLGGYRTADRRVVRWGRVFRAGSLAELTDEDVAYLGRLGLRLSCDLRAPDEAARRPDRLPPGAVTIHHPVVAEVGRVRRLVTLLRLRKRMRELLQQAYVIMLDQNGPLFAAIIRAAADPANLPLVIHCTAGKDRTGLAAALLLLALGVPEETVVADYTLSNHAYNALAERMRPEMEPLYRLGFDEAQLRPFLLAEARTMAAALAHLRRRYGSPAGYLARAGIEGDVIKRLREKLLTAGE